MKLNFLGTGYAMAENCYNTCFTIETLGKHLLVDAGGGNGIFNQLNKANINIKDINALFVTHAHTDHILGVIWILRKIASMINDGKYEGSFDLYMHQDSFKVIDFLCESLLTKKLKNAIDTMNFHILNNHDKININGIDFEFFDVLSTKTLQYGFKAINNDISIVCLGDEPANEENFELISNANFLLCEAFCLYKDKDIFKPYEKHHSTALDVGELATRLNVSNLVMYHTEDKTLSTKKELYTEEARLKFKGNIYVPLDLESIEII